MMQAPQHSQQLAVRFQIVIDCRLAEHLRETSSWHVFLMPWARHAGSKHSQQFAAEALLAPGCRTGADSALLQEMDETSESKLL